MYRHTEISQEDMDFYSEMLAHMDRVNKFNAPSKHFTDDEYIRFHTIGNNIMNNQMYADGEYLPEFNPYDDSNEPFQFC